MDLSLLIGVPLDAARVRLEAAGEVVGTVTETSPPHPVAWEGPLRVVRVRRDADERVEIIVTHERFLARTDRE